LLTDEVSVTKAIGPAPRAPGEEDPTLRLPQQQWRSERGNYSTQRVALHRYIEA
jgi:hypothetical protein